MASEKMKELMKRRDELESEIKTLHEVLDSQKSVGMEEPLTDAEGFPRADIDVYSVRHARHQILCLQNDHKALMDEIEEELYKIHAEARQFKQTSGDTNDEQQIQSTVTVKESFGSIVSVDVGSPAETAALKVGDSVLQFGSITASNFQGMQNIASVVQHSINMPLTVIVYREGKELKLSLTPSRWKPGKGLIGCFKWVIDPHMDLFMRLPQCGSRQNHH
ncbi:26S proteasome non-ATPase regulatory subunit 9 [Mactra antiquata]